ncbi:electron transfer flavoprotein, partial [Escherichia coli]
MNIAIVTINQENAAIASWLAAQDFSGCTLAHWQIEPQPVVAEQVLDALVEQWQRTPADVVLFPPGTFGDELSTRLAWRLHGASICQVTSLDIPTVSVRKSHWGNAL